MQLKKIANTKNLMLLTLMMSYPLQALADRVASWIGPQENEISTYTNVKQVL